MLLIFASGWLLTYVFTPFVLWRSFGNIFKNIVVSGDIDLRAKAGLLWHLFKELAWLPVLTWLWWVDELCFSASRDAMTVGPVFIMGQPRSGTSLLLRTLAADEATFFSLTHLEWRLPFIVFWRFIDKLRLRRHLERINYWPDTEAGRLASRMHRHELGSLKGHGSFFEERMVHHYLVFRRFPFPGVLRRVADVDGLTEGERRKLVTALRKVVGKAALHRGAGRVWLTKESESVDLYRLLHQAFPSARFLVITRVPSAFVGSCMAMSSTCTRAQHGVDPSAVQGWADANLAFRRDQCEKQAAFCRQLESQGAVTYLDFEEFTAGIGPAVERVYAELGLPLGEAFRARLQELQRQQDRRERPHAPPRDDADGFEAFNAFVRSVQGGDEVAQAR